MRLHDVNISAHNTAYERKNGPQAVDKQYRNHRLFLSVQRSVPAAQDAVISRHPTLRKSMTRKCDKPVKSSGSGGLSSRFHMPQR